MIRKIAIGMAAALASLTMGCVHAGLSYEPGRGVGVTLCVTDYEDGRPEWMRFLDPMIGPFECGEGVLAP